MIITTVILTKNEEDNIKGCLNSISFSDEIIVIDDNSDDNTAKIAKMMGAKVFVRDSREDFAGQRNFGLDKANGKWVLFLDADERVTKPLVEEISQSLNDSFQYVKGFYIKREEYFLRKKMSYGEVGNKKFLRLVVKGSGKWEREVHERYKINGQTKLLKHPIEHRSHKSLTSFIQSINKWSKIHSRSNKNEGKSANILKVILWPIAHFVKNYILKLGFLDGLYGLVFALLMSMHSFVAWGDLYFEKRRQSS